MYAKIQISDGVLKYVAYLTKISSPEYSSQKQLKLCHLALQTSLKFHDNEQFSKQIYQKTKQMVFLKKSYYFLYLLDLLLKNNKFIIKIVKKDLQRLFQVVWEKVWTEPHNSSKIENLKLMALTWGKIHGEKYQEPIAKWAFNKYNVHLNQISQPHLNKVIENYGILNQKQEGKQRKSQSQIATEKYKAKQKNQSATQKILDILINSQSDN